MYTITTVTHPTADTKKPLLMLTSDHGSRYLFGSIAEGSQRVFVENKWRLSKLNSIFLTGQISWEALGGLPGLILTVSDQGKKSLQLFYGSDILSYVVSTWRMFVFRFGMDLKPEVLLDGAVYEDSLLSVKSIVVGRHEPMPFAEKLKTIVTNMFPMGGAFQQSDPQPSDVYVNSILPSFQRPQLTTSYEITFKPIRGKFKPEEAVKLGVPKGRMYAQLANGNAVTLENGTVIQPEQVVEPQRSFPKVLILDVPSQQYLSEMQLREWDTYGAVYVMLGENIPMDDATMAWLKSFTTQELFISHPSIAPNSLVYYGAGLTMLKLKSLQPSNYNLPITSKQVEKLVKDEYMHTLRQHQEAIVSPSGVKYDKSKIRRHDWKKWYENHVQSVPALVEVAHDPVTSENNFDNSVDVEVITLGTGSALPSKYRNVVSTLVKVPYKNGDSITNRNVLLDAGENTIGTIKRIIPEDALPKFFSDLKLIYLSHLHADHHLGIISMLTEWYKYVGSHDPTAYIYLVTPWQYDKFVAEWFSLEDDEILKRIRYISCEHFMGGYLRKETEQIALDDISSTTRLKYKEESVRRDFETINALYRDLQMKLFQTCRAKHCDWSYSNTIHFYTNSENDITFSVSYSGDTRPNMYKFAQGIGKGSDLLIHEATLENDLLEDAKKKRHSTINEAIEVSNAMQAKKLILTHFSQRYPKLPQISDNITVKAKYCYAFDGMIVKYDEIEEPIPQLSQLFAQEQQEEETQD